MFVGDEKMGSTGHNKNGKMSSTFSHVCPDAVVSSTFQTFWQPPGWITLPLVPSFINKALC